jgi:Txe/YoeB family toxin of Txe-Axe toxin-antitoxin module
MKNIVALADDSIKKKMTKMKDATFEDQSRLLEINHAIDRLYHDAFCGIQIPKKLIPRPYVKKYRLDNLWKYDLSHGWRLLYFVITEQEIAIVVIVDWMSHKEYERLFNY